MIQYSQIAVDLDFNCFVDECRENFSKFLKYGSKVMARPQVISGENMSDFEGYVEDDLRIFQSFSKTVPSIQRY
jgi:hypothetical protein